MRELFSFPKCIFNRVLKMERLSEILMASGREFHNLVQLGKKEFLYLVSLRLYGLIKMECEDRSECVGFKSGSNFQIDIQELFY